MPGRIAYIDCLPKVTIDSEGVSIVAKSGEEVSRYRMGRSLWRKYLETEIRRLNDYDIAERGTRGLVIPLERRAGH